MTIHNTPSHESDINGRNVPSPRTPERGTPLTVIKLQDLMNASRGRMALHHITELHNHHPSLYGHEWLHESPEVATRVVTQRIVFTRTIIQTILKKRIPVQNADAPRRMPNVQPPETQKPGPAGAKPVSPLPRQPEPKAPAPKPIAPRATAPQPVNPAA